jgi:hypothetical protein
MKLSDFKIGTKYKIKPNAEEICRGNWNVPHMNYLSGTEQKCIGFSEKGLIKIYSKQSGCGYWVLPPKAFEECEPEILFNNNTPEALAFQELLKGKITA